MHTLNLKTDSNLLSRLAIATGKQMSEDEVRAQRTSFIFGQTSGLVSREKIQRQLDKQEGRA